MERKQTYVFSEIENYRRLLETKHMRTKNTFVLVLTMLLGISVCTYMFLIRFDRMSTYYVMGGFLLLFASNFAMTAYGAESYLFYRMNQYVTTLAVYILAVAMIFLFRTPAMIAALFLAYAITAFYQEIS